MSDLNHQPPQDKSEFDRKLFDKIAANYARKDITPSSAFARNYQIQSSLEPLPTFGTGLGTIIDVGCGIGQISMYLKGKYEQYIGIDHSEKMISIARTYNPSKNAAFYAADVGSATFLHQTADIVFARGFLHHVDNFDEMMDSLKKIARPGAYFIAIEPNNGNPLIQFLRKIRQKIDRNYSPLQHYFSKAELSEILKRANLQEVTVSFHGYVSPPFAEVVLNPQFIFLPIVKLLVLIDKKIQRWMPGFLKPLSWDLMVFAKFPEE